MAGFEKACWKADPSIPDDKRELSVATFRSIALNYIQRKGPKLPKSLFRAINNLKHLNNTINNPDKGNGVVLMVREEYIDLLIISEGSIDNPAKFKPMSSNRPKKRGRLPKYYHPLFEKEKNETADKVCRQRS